MMDGCHAGDSSPLPGPSPRDLEPSDLQCTACQIEKEDSADDQEKHLLANGHGDTGQQPSQGKGSGEGFWGDAQGRGSREGLREGALGMALGRIPGRGSGERALGGDSP